MRTDQRNSFWSILNIWFLQRVRTACNAERCTS